MRGRFCSIATAGLLLAPVLSAVQAQVVDQSNYGNMGAFGYAIFWQGQTFTPSANTSAGAGFNLSALQGNAASGILTIELWSDVASNSGATLLASGSSAFNLVGFQQSMIDVFWSAVAVTPGTQYFLAMNAPGNGLNLATTFSTGNAYVAGGTWYNGSTTSSTAPYSDYGQFGYDLTFEEFATSQVSSIPEPASMALLGTGLVGVFGIVRRRRRNQST